MSSLILRSFISLNKNPNNVLTKFRQINTSRVLYESVVPKLRKKKVSTTPITWKNLLISSIIGGSFLLYLNYLRNEKDRDIAKERRRQLGKAKIGGKFELTDTNGKIVKSDDFLGQWVMIYFGFTHCPDVCPDEIEKMVTVVDNLEKDHDVKIQPIFISVDPVRDTPTIISRYLKEFSSKIIGLTGSEDQIKEACKAYRVYYSSGPKDEDDDYIVDHTIIIYLVDPEGLFVDYYGQTHDVQRIMTSVLVNKLKYDRLKDDSFFQLPSISKGLL